MRYTSPPGNQCGSDWEIIMKEEQNTSRLNEWNNMGKGLVLFVIHFELIELLFLSDPYTPKNQHIPITPRCVCVGKCVYERERMCVCFRESVLHTYNSNVRQVHKRHCGDKRHFSHSS